MNLVEILDVEGDGREVDEELRGMVGREVVWKKAVQDSMDKVGAYSKRTLSPALTFNPSISMMSWQVMLDFVIPIS